MNKSKDSQKGDESLLQQLPLLSEEMQKQLLVYLKDEKNQQLNFE